ncbi:hypothetical protein VNO80_16419 [Phaseolus coccineus]|uniref:Uncharacterized protein n=1 Tax=Phaseolus coccineus TaxID=3886 RepID=A0AAN9MMA3_PHACN
MHKWQPFENRSSDVNAGSTVRAASFSFLYLSILHSHFTPHSKKITILHSHQLTEKEREKEKQYLCFPFQDS